MSDKASEVVVRGENVEGVRESDIMREDEEQLGADNNPTDTLASLRAVESVAPTVTATAAEEDTLGMTESAWSSSQERLQHSRVPLRGPQPFNPSSVKLLRQSPSDVSSTETSTALATTADAIKSRSTFPSLTSYSSPSSSLSPHPKLDEDVTASSELPSSPPDTGLPLPSSPSLPQSPSIPSMLPSTAPHPDTTSQATSSALPTVRDRDPLRLSRFLAFPTNAQVGNHGAEIHLFDGLMSRNIHEIRLLRRGYYALRLHNLNESAWDGLYLGIGKMKAVAEFNIIPPPAELMMASPPLKRHIPKSEGSSPPLNYDSEGLNNNRDVESRETTFRGTQSRRPSKSPEQANSRHSSASDIRSASPNVPSSRPLSGVSDIYTSSGRGGGGSSSSSSHDEYSRPSSAIHQRYSTMPIPQPVQDPVESNVSNGTFSPPLSSATVVGVSGDDVSFLTMVDGPGLNEGSTNGVGIDVEDDQRTPTTPESSDENDDGDINDSSERPTELTKDSTPEAIAVLTEKGELICKAQQEKVVYFYVPECQSTLKLQVYASLTLGMRLRCSYDLIYCGAPKVSPSNPVVPFLRNASILCLDGGGVLGISSLKILERLELEVQKELRDPTVRITDCFDMICGTSTGGIISLGLLTGLSIKEMINMWASMSGRIFEGNRTLFSGIVFEGYDVARLKNSLVEGLGNRYMNTYTQPYCFVTSTDVKHNPYELFLLRNYTHSHLANHEYRGGSSVPVWTAAWATAAAPTYLKGPNPEELEKMGLIIHPEVQLCDGAMKANNPTMVALEEAARLAGKKLQHFIESDLDLLVSLGTGQPTLKQTIAQTGIVSTFQILVNSAHLLTSSTNVHRDVLHWLGDHEDKYFRFNVPGIGDIPLDAVDKSSYDIILKATNDYLTDEKFYDIKRLVKKLSYRVRR